MKKNNYKKLLMFSAIYLAFFIFASPVFAVDSAISNLENSAKVGYSDQDLSKTITDVPGTIGKIIGVGLSFVGVLFLILLIYGGFIWMTARGNQQDISKAMDLIQAAVIGLIIVLAAYAITAYVGSVLKVG